MTTIDGNKKICTLINVFTVEPAKQKELFGANQVEGSALTADSFTFDAMQRYESKETINSIFAESGKYLLAWKEHPWKMTAIVSIQAILSILVMQNGTGVPQALPILTAILYFIYKKLSTTSLNGKRLYLFVQQQYFIFCYGNNYIDFQDENVKYTAKYTTKWKKLRRNLIFLFVFLPIYIVEYSVLLGFTINNATLGFINVYQTLHFVINIMVLVAALVQAARAGSVMEAVKVVVCFDFVLRMTDIGFYHSGSHKQAQQAAISAFQSHGEWWDEHAMKFDNGQYSKMYQFLILINSCFRAATRISCVVLLCAISYYAPEVQLGLLIPLGICVAYNILKPLIDSLVIRNFGTDSGGEGDIEEHKHNGSLASQQA